MRLHVKGKIQQQPIVKILEIQINENRKAGSWYKQARSHRRQNLNILRKSTGKPWSSGGDPKKNGQGTSYPKATYEINYLKLTKAQENGLEGLYREAMRVITGLPKYMRLENLYQIAGLNTTKETARENKTNHILRLQKRRSKSKVLIDLGYGKDQYPVMADPASPWGSEVVVDTIPTPQNQSVDQRNRRTLLANILITYSKFFRIAPTPLFIRTLPRMTNKRL